MKLDMAKGKSPRLRTVNKAEPAFPLNAFPSGFPLLLGREIVYLLATKGRPDIEGAEWERIFAACIGADRKPSNVGLDDVILRNTAWGAKTIKARFPSSLKVVRLISGRNSPIYSFGTDIGTNANPDEVGAQVLEIWNERVSAVRSKYKDLRTIVLVKSMDLLDLLVFEFETIRFEVDRFSWRWNKNGNLEGIHIDTGVHKFSWQPHGSQFTILEPVPERCLMLRITKPKELSKDKVLETVGYDPSWVQVINRGV